MKLLILSLLVLAAVTSCGRKAPLKTVPGVLFEDVKFGAEPVEPDEDDEVFVDYYDDEDDS